MNKNKIDGEILIIDFIKFSFDIFLLRICKHVAFARNIYIVDFRDVSAKSNEDFKRALDRGHCNSVRIGLDHSFANFGSDDYHKFLMLKVV